MVARTQSGVMRLQRCLCYLSKSRCGSVEDGRRGQPSGHVESRMYDRSFSWLHVFFHHMAYAMSTCRSIHINLVKLGACMLLPTFTLQSS